MFTYKFRDIICVCLLIMTTDWMGNGRLFPELVDLEVDWPWPCLTTPTGAKKRQSGVCGAELLGRFEAKRQSSPLFWPGGGTHTQSSTVPSPLHSLSFTFFLILQHQIVHIEDPNTPTRSQEICSIKLARIKLEILYNIYYTFPWE